MNSELSEPLTSATSIVDEELGDSGDPYFVFRADLQTKLEMVDELPKAKQDITKVGRFFKK